MSNEFINLAIPSPPTRQVGVSSDIGSPIVLSRGVSGQSDLSIIQTLEESIRYRLEAYKTYLEHEVLFLDTEILALTNRVPGSNTQENVALLELQDDLKIRYNSTQKKLSRVNALLEVL